MATGAYIMNTSRRDVLICWVTNNAVTGEVRIGTSTNANQLKWVYRDTVVPALDSVINGYLHTIRISGLLPETQYFYNFGAVGTTSTTADPARFFHTAPPIGGNVNNRRFWSQADSGNALNIWSGFDAFNSTTQKLDGIIAIGDNAYGSGTITDYENNFFNSGQSNKLQSANLFLTAGNHEYPNSGMANPTRSRTYFHYFPANLYTETGGIASFNRRFYSWDYGNIHFISLDGYHQPDTNNPQEDPFRSTAPNGPMMRWLKNDLEFIQKEKIAGRKKWIIVICHFPPFSDAGHSTYNTTSISSTEPGIEFRNIFVPILQQYDVDLTLHGHDHNYHRSWFFHDFNGPNGFTQTANVWTPFRNDLGRNPTSPYFKNNGIGTTYTGMIHVVQGNANGSHYGISGLYGGSSTNTDRFVAVSQLISGNLLPSGNDGTMNGSSVIDITPGGGINGVDRLTYTHIDVNGTIRDRFFLDK